MPFSKKNVPCSHNRQIHCPDCHRAFFNRESLLEHGKYCSPQKDIKAAVTCSTCNRKFNTRKLLFQHLRQKPSHRRDLHLAACTGKLHLVVRYLRTQYADETGCSHGSGRNPDQIGFTPMHCAAFGGHRSCLEVMLSWNDGNPNVQDPNSGRTPVHIAAWKGNVDCLQILLQHGGDPMLADKEGDTALGLATEECRIVITAVLEYEESRRRASRISNVAEGIPESQHTGIFGILRKLLARVLFIKDEVPEQGIATPMCEDSVKDVEQVTIVPGEGAAKELTLSTTEQAPSSPSVPYEVLARGPVAVEAFNRALSEGEARVLRMQLAVIGDVGAGKTSLVRTLSGGEYIAERQETHGIDRSMVEMTQLDPSWSPVEGDQSHVDEIIADVVSKNIRSSKVRAREITPYNPSVVPGSVSAQDVNPFIFPTPQVETPEEDSGEASTDVLPASQVKQKKLQRQMPVGKIVESLSREPSNEDEATLYRKISIWDFAGHPFYETMHHIFLNSRSFYLVVFSLVKFKENETGTLETLQFWLNSVRVHTPRSTPMFLVGTHRDQVQDEDVSRAEKVTHKKFADCFGQQLVQSKEECYLFAVNNAQGSKDEGAEALKKMIEKEAHRLEHVERRLPIRWLHFEEEICKIQATQETCKPETKPETPRTMTKENLLDMTQEKCGAVTVEEFDSMLQFFHDSGVIILPEALIGPSAKDHQQLVVLDPQYLVDVMTCLHDIKKQMEEHRQFRTQWITLQDEGLASMQLLEFAWKKFETPAKDLVKILQAAGLLCPVHIHVPVPVPGEGASQLQEERIQSSPSHRNGDLTGGESQRVLEFVIPFHLAVKDLQQKWEKKCRNWKKICATDKVLIFDFQNFLPPALFNYLLVRTTAESKQTNGMRPIMARDMGIFSFGDKFFVFFRRVANYNQIRVDIRHKHGENLHKVFEKLNSVMTGICDQYFRYLKITLGPPCPNPSCPGAFAEGKLKPESSSEDSEGEDEENESRGCPEEDSLKDDRRPHVIGINPNCPGEPLWCHSDTLHEFEEVNQWFCKEVADVPLTLNERRSCDPRAASRVQACCLVVVSAKVSSDWKWLGRSLGIDESIIKNTEADNSGDQREQAYQVLYTWMTAGGAEATKGTLEQALKENGRDDIVESLNEHFECKHMV